MVYNVPVQSTRYSKEETFFFVCGQQSSKRYWSCVLSKSPKSKKEECVDFPSNKISSFHDCKKCKASCHVFSALLQEQRPTLTFLVGNIFCTYCFAKKKNCDCKTPSHLLKNFLHQSPEPELEPKKNEINLYMT